MSKNDGGPAFGHGSPEHGGDPGMSLRDWFAGQALAGLLAAGYPKADFARPGETAAECLARLAYRRADAMLKAREQGEEG